jgi:hypothetical protein
MKMQIDLEATTTLDIDFNEDMIVDVMQNYNGDFEEWAKSNYGDFIDFNDFDVDYDGCSYNSEEAKELILKSKDILGLNDDFNVDRVIAHRTSLSKFITDVPNIEDDLEVMEIDVDLVAKAINYTAFKYPKIELNYIHLDKNTISATDTHKLIHITNHKYVDFDNVLFPPSFIEPLQKGAELYRNNDGFIYMKYNKQWFLSDLCEEWNGIKFPEVKRILLSEEGYKNKVKMSFHKFTSNSVTQKYKDDTYPKELIKFNIEGKDNFIKEVYYNNALELFDDLQDVYISVSCPVHFIGKNIQVVIMPVVL